MNSAIRSPEGDALTEMILTMFRVNNLTLTWGDRLVGPLGLTSARWQILGAIALADQLTVMVNGQVIASGTPAEIRADAGVQAAYLGETA